ncbi:4199_t:CDS:1, partial [Ambispora gerdemannii]
CACEEKTERHCLFSGERNRGCDTGNRCITKIVLPKYVDLNFVCVPWGPVHRTVVLVTLAAATLIAMISYVVMMVFVTSVNKSGYVNFPLVLENYQYRSV